MHSHTNTHTQTQRLRHTHIEHRIPACNNPPLVCAAHTQFQVFGVCMLIEPPPPPPRLHTLSLLHFSISVSTVKYSSPPTCPCGETEEFTACRLRTGRSWRGQSQEMLHCPSHILSSGLLLQSDTCVAAHMKPYRGEKFSVACLSWRWNQSYGLRFGIIVLLWVCKVTVSSACIRWNNTLQVRAAIQCSSLHTVLWDWETHLKQPRNRPVSHSLPLSRG